MHPFLNIATKAARKAGNIIIRASDDLDKLVVTSKGTNDYVSNIDKSAEAEIIQYIQISYPDHAILGEEHGELTEDAEVKWVIDPIDGTFNFIHGYPYYAISIAIFVKGELEHGLIFDPFKQEMFTATRGQGARLNDKRIRVSKHNKLANSLVATGFPVYLSELDKKNHLKTISELIYKVGDLRLAGSSALDLAYVACGRLDAYWEGSLKIWDIAAGVLLVKESGGLVGDYQGSNGYLESGNIVAGNPKIYEQVLDSIVT